jgi:hypothetical protein
MAMTSWRASGLTALINAAVVLLIAAQSYAQTSLSSSFNHFSTGFPLTGTHLSVACAACHVNGRFSNTPKRCVGCHNTMTAPGEPQSHPQTTTLCDSCHQTTTWRDYRFIDHVQALGPCASCHNNKSAVGKSATHPPTEAPCNTCHFNTVTFKGAVIRPSASAPTAAAPQGTSPSSTRTAPMPTSPPANDKKMSHAGIINGCVRCHDGVGAPGKRPNHVITAAPCESCHKSTMNFAGARMNHAGITTNCSRCHNSGAAPGKSANHLVTNAPCETCHRSTVSFAGARVDHTNMTAPCASCHNGTTAEGKPSRHILTASPCDQCHRTQTWASVVYRHTSPAYVNHGAGVDCVSCHTANAKTVVWKFPAFRGTCAGCHVDKYRPMSHPKFTRPMSVYYTAAELRDCTGACHTYTNNTQRTVLTRSFGVHRALGGGW